MCKARHGEALDALALKRLPLKPGTGVGHVHLRATRLVEAMEQPSWRCWPSSLSGRLEPLPCWPGWKAFY